MKHYHIVSRVAIYSLSVILIVLGVLHILYPQDLLVYIPAYLPGGIIWAYFAGTAFILVGLSFIFNNMVKVAGYLLAIMLFFFILTIHLPNYLYAGDKEMKSIALINLLKDTAIAAFAMHVAAGAHHQHLHLENTD